jgi:hypothetical protein
MVSPNSLLSELLEGTKGAKKYLLVAAFIGW